MALDLQSKRVEELANLVIASGGSASSFLTSDEFGKFDSVTIYGPATLTGAITVEVMGRAADDPDEAASWFTLQDGGSDVAVGAGEAVTISPLNAQAVRVASADTEAAERTFLATGRVSRVASP